MGRNAVVHRDDQFRIRRYPVGYRLAQPVAFLEVLNSGKRPSNPPSQIF
ncbi:hypothetical protein JKG47_16605 [Acidithiobacillus sp. MC6.1]|nr:hypothetical protein [Acidithiobacillus sp. MC6.1]